MASTLTLSPLNTNTTTFRAWGSAISAAIAALGLVQTTDTGQINWTTVNLTATIATSSGYEIWRFADTLQSTAPIYFKLEYGCGSTTSNVGMWITCGTGSDGAGAITGTFFSNITAANQSVARQIMWTTSAAIFAGGTTVYVNGDTGSLAICFWPTFAANSSAGAVLVLERSRAFDGTGTGDGYSVIVSWADQSTSGATVQNTPSFIANGYVSAAVALSVQGSSQNVSAISNIVSGVLYPQPIMTGNNVKIGGPSQYVMYYPRGDYLGNQTVAMTHYGVSKNWLTLGMGQASASTGWVGIGNAKSPMFKIN